ncbi:hypothetical protein AAFN85_30915 [Mucilaginibacter sp. CAU 1740]|uniref:hypothetical protein n=1 Tax=Mucilaginibacter sp. CAU 1740 TaxID=3140365 RepID=UPI00325A4883
MGKPEKKEENEKISIEKAIEKTGYVLEHKVASMLEKENWSVIHNRYYLDDVTELQREMDMIAYKTLLLEDDVMLFTALIISCKKNSEFDWVFLTRKAPGMNVNINMLPVNFSSNVEVFNYQISEIDWSKEKFIKKYDSNSLINKMYNYNRVVFAYQEIKKSNNAPSNDSNIYSSIASLIKAQAYEVSSLKDGRKKDQKYIYNINLLSVADLNFHELHYEDDKVTTTEINRINYLNRFLISSQEQHYKIDFIKFDSLKSVIEEYDTLHKWNINFCKTLSKDFFANVFNDYKKKTFIISKTKSQYLELVKLCYQQETGISKDFTFLLLEKDKNVLNINVSDIEAENERLNLNERLRIKTAEWLKNNFKYSGRFTFAEDLFPF